jgi:hypothetical protein
MRFAVVAAVLCAVMALAAVATQHRRASACTLAPFMAQYLPPLVEGSPVIAVGTWTASEERKVMFVVDEGLKGAAAGDEFLVDNRNPYLSSTCQSYELPFRDGHRFKDGERSIVFLEEEVNGLWWIARAGYAAIDAPADDLEPLIEDQGDWWSGTALLEDVKKTIAATETGIAGTALENDLGCQPPHIFDARRVGDYTFLAISVAIVTVAEVPEWEYGEPLVPVPVSVDRVLKGDELPASISLNDAWISDFGTQDCKPALEDGRRQLLEGQQYLVFLRADEFELADYRPVAWGRAIAMVNERWVTNDQPTLALIRDLTAVYRPDPSSEEPSATPPSDAAGTNAPAGKTPNSPDQAISNEGDARDGSLVAFVIVGATLAILAVGVGVAARRRWSGRAG